MVETKIALFEGRKIRRHWDKKKEIWYFSVVDIIEVLTDSVNPRDYWFKMKIRVGNDEGSELSTICRQLKLKSPDGKMRLTDCADAESILTNIIHEEWSDLSVKEHKNLKELKTENLRDHMTDAEPVFSALAELSTRQIAESVQSRGLKENKVPAKKGGRIAKNARRELEQKTGKSVISKENYLQNPKNKKLLG